MRSMMPGSDVRRFAHLQHDWPEYSGDVVHRPFMGPADALYCLRVIRPLVCLCAILLMAACGGASSSTEPGQLPALTQTAAPSTIPTVSLPAVPVTPASAAVLEPTGGTREDAAQFARFWFGQLDLAFSEVDPGPLVRISGRDCQTCQAYIDALGVAKQAGHTYTGGRVTVLEAVAEPEPADTTTVLVNVDAAAQQEFDRDGKVVNTGRAEANTTIVFDVRWQQGRWLAAKVAKG